MKSIFFLGCYTKMLTKDFGGKGAGIYTVGLNKITGEIELLSTFPTINPAYLVISDTKKYLYSITEISIKEIPKVQAFKIRNDFSLELLNEQVIEGDLPCHITIDKNNLYIACYGSGNMLLFPTNNNGEVLKSTQNFQHKGNSINPERQEGPHAHQTVVHPNGKDIFVPDLGLDTVKTYQINNHELSEITHKEIEVEKGGGPRHLVFNKKGDVGYLINELTSDISILKKEGEKFIFKKSVTSLPKDFNKTPSASAIRIHPNGKYLYAGNRTIDAITIFKINDHDLELVDFQFTQGKTLREFNISPDGKWLIACLQDSDETVVYNIEFNGKLTEKYRTKVITSPVCVAFL